MTDSVPENQISSTLDVETLPALFQHWLDYTKGFPTTERFNIWACIAAIGGALQRRCWIVSAGRQMFPNTFILLVSPPGVGKTDAIQTTRDIWSQFANLPVAPQSMTGKGIIDELASEKSVQNVTIDGEQYTYSSLLIPAAELGTLIQEYDITQISILNELYDCNGIYNERTRGGGVVEIIRPHVSMIMGTQPKFMGHVFPEAAFGMGLTSRMIMIYDDKAHVLDLFGGSEPDQKQFDELVEKFKPIAGMKGQFDIQDRAKELLQEQHKENFPPVPDSIKLAHYNTRRTAHVLKLSMIIGAARHRLPFIAEKDVINAIELLHDAESRMPEVFTEMAGGSEAEVIKESFHLVMRLYHKGGKKPVSEQHIHQFLHQRVPTWKIDYIIKSMYKSGAIISAGGGKVTPGEL